MFLACFFLYVPEFFCIKLFFLKVTLKIHLRACLNLFGLFLEHFYSLKICFLVLFHTDVFGLSEDDETNSQACIFSGDLLRIVL